MECTTFSYRNPMAASLGLAGLRQKGLTTRGVLFIALDDRGEVHIAVPENMASVVRIKVGELRRRVHSHSSQ